MSEQSSRALQALRTHRTAHEAAARAAHAALLREGEDAPWVRAAAEPFVRRRWWLFAFLACMAVAILDHLVHLSPWLLFDVVVVLAALSLFQGVLGFQRAFQSASPDDLERGVRGLMRSMTINAIAGWAVLGLGLLGFVVLFALAGSVMKALPHGLGLP